ncbi:MAG: CPBP family intramembrane metalloprotease [Deltaproteobacteria bacterium]|nr:CPBP family intramembrane metalloprotease [Deltaproteobacteria bacterium]
MHQPETPNKQGFSPLIPIAILFCLIICYGVVLFLYGNKALPYAQIIILFLPALLLLKTRGHCKKSLIKVNAEMLGQAFLLTLPFSLFANTLIQIISDYLISHLIVPLDFAEMMQDLFHLNQPFGIGIDLLLLAVLPALCEEMLFRGYLHTELRAHLKPKATIILTATLFALYHMNPFFFLFYLVLGLVFGWLREKHQSLLAPMMAHFTNNVVAVLWMHYVAG